MLFLVQQEKMHHKIEFNRNNLISLNKRIHCAQIIQGQTFIFSSVAMLTNPDNLAKCLSVINLLHAN